MNEALNSKEWSLSGSTVVTDHLIGRIAAGDREAFHTLYEEISKHVYGFALSITRNTHDAEDVLQETMLTVYHKAESYQAKGKPMAWIFTIARNFALQRLRKDEKATSIDELWNVEGEGLAAIENVELRMTLQAVLQLLSEQEQQIVMLHAVQGMKNREIAQILQIPLNTVLSKYHRAMKKLKKYMEEHI